MPPPRWTYGNYNRNDPNSPNYGNASDTSGGYDSSAGGSLGTFWDTTFGRKGLVGELGEMFGLWESGTTADRKRRERKRLRKYRDEVESRRGDIERRFRVLSAFESERYKTAKRGSELQYEGSAVGRRFGEMDRMQRSGLAVGSNLINSMQDRFSRQNAITGMKMLGIDTRRNRFDLAEQRRRENYQLDDTLFGITTQIRNI